MHKVDLHSFIYRRTVQITTERLLRTNFKISIIAFLQLLAFLTVAKSQATVNAIYDEYSPTDKVQIRIPVSNNSIDKLKITGAGENEVQV